ncbi:DUF1189 family protein [Sporosarcina sp. Marseille-Q4063]|uniref:DUF1189 family protein n=1 Tax=Sporosarcina sp. Marseille-Q4063 TaxID=2810514 RepID=UPI001BAEEFB0|nr:DUF1189 family protein [Sporosarcina sp. Marseille-Q4063]QUW22243.1 DUF1189 family protein [Sporosarcina sp. Marseille-Q4063]
MKFHQLFIAGIYEPKKLAAFRLLPIGRVFKYVFMFIFLFTIISFGRFYLNDELLLEQNPDLIEHGAKIGWLIYPMALLLQLVISTFYVFIRITIFAYIGSLFLKLRRKRGNYLQIWRTSAIAMTVPMLLTIGFDFFPGIASNGFLISSIVHLLYILSAIKYYPIQQ